LGKPRTKYQRGLRRVEDLDGDFRIRGWLVQPQLRLILPPGKRVQVEPKVMQVLVKLAKHPGEVVSKDSLLEQVWGGTHVTEGVLTRAISELRKILEEGPKHQEIIQTIPRSGYRLLAVPEPAEPPVAQAIAPPEPRPRKWLLWSGVIGLAVSVAIPLLLRVTETVPPAPPPVAIHSVAVLPFENLSGDPGKDYFADSVTESLIVSLMAMPECRIASRESTARLRNPTNSVLEITRELGVTAAILGTVTVSGSSARITARLVVPTGRVVWSNSYDQGFDKLLLLERRTIDALAKDIRAALVPSQGRKK
jgi:DNA-binding winged helix-turn-helix (wHTH) protein/TolB-like protein